jgi:hypothetical protein
MEEGHSLRTAEDIKLGIPDKLATFLTQQNADISMWEYVEFILDNKQEREVILKKEQKDELTQLKILHIKEDGTFKVKNETRQDEWSVT